MVPIDFQQAYAGGGYINIPGDSATVPGGNHPPTSGSVPSSPSVPSGPPSVGRPALPGPDPKYGGSLDHGGSSTYTAAPASPPTAGQPPGYKAPINAAPPVTYPPGLLVPPAGGTVTPIVTNPTPSNPSRPPGVPNRSPIGGVIQIVGEVTGEVLDIISGQYDIGTKQIQCQSASAGFLMTYNMYKYDGSVSPPRPAMAPPVGDCNNYTRFLTLCPSAPNDLYGARVPGMTSLCGIPRS